MYTVIVKNYETQAELIRLAVKRLTDSGMYCLH